MVKKVLKDNPEDIKKIADGFRSENEEILQMLAQRLMEYSLAGNALYINWMSQAIIGMLKQANEQCMKQYGIDREKMQ